MPTNLPPDYFKVEKRFRDADTTEEKIELLEEMISIVPKHKGTDHLRADLRRKLSRLREEAQKSKSAARRDSAFRIPKAGAGQVILVGPANVGKSALTVALTGVPLEVSPVPFTTWEPSPAMMPVENMQVQLVDTPPISRDFPEPRLRDLLRKADMLLLVVDLTTDPVEQVTDTLKILQEYRIAPPEHRDRFDENAHMVFPPLLVLVNKCDNEDMEEVFHLFCELLEEPCPCLPVSARTRHNLDGLRKRVIAALDVIRVYTRTPGKEIDREHPFVMKRGSTVADLAEKIHRDFVEQMRSARVWGNTVYDGQMVPREYLLQDGDVVELQV